MKYKIIIFVVLFSFVSSVNASTYYGDYRVVENVGNYSNDTVMIDSYKLYNTYNLNFIDLGYMLENEIYIKDENDYIKELVEVNSMEGDEYIDLNYNKEMIDKFLLYLPLGIEINEIEVYNKDEKIDYSVFNSPMFGIGNVEKLYDNDYNSVYKHTFDSRMALWFQISNINDIKIIVYTNKVKNFNFDISFENGTKNISFNNEIDRKHIIMPHYSLENGITYKYKAIKKLYKYYKEEKELLNNYVREGNNIILEDYIEISDIYVRDKLILKDNLIIDKLDYDLNDFILESTDKVLINCNINYEINDNYKCNFILNDINVEKEVLLSIPREETNEEIIIDSIEEDNILSNIDNNNEEVLDTNNKLVNKVVYIEENDINQNINNAEEKVVKTTKKIEKLSNKNVKTINKIKEERKSDVLNIVKYVILFNLIAIEIILFIRKRKRNNVETV